MPVEVALSPEVRGPLTVYPIEWARAFGVDAFVTDRFHGASSGPYESLNLGDHVGDDPEHVRENRRLVARAIGADRLVIVRQVHGARVLNARDATPESEADALLSDGSDLALAILVADCVPILLVESTSSRFCLVHAGWRGLHAGIIARALEHLHALQRARVPRTVDLLRALSSWSRGRDALRGCCRTPSHPTVPIVRASIFDSSRRRSCERAASSDERISIATHVTDGGDVFFSDRAQRPCGRFGLVAKRVS